MPIPDILKPLLKQVEADKLHHALLFHGSDNIDKWLWAKWFSQFVLCEQKNVDQPCGTCRHCRYVNHTQTAETTHPDVYILGEDESVGVDDIRQITQFLALSPHYARRKIVLIRNAETLNVSSQNALLKMLEEPPSYGLFILVAEKLKRLLPTIVSRCIKYRFKSLSIEEGITRFQAILATTDKEPIDIETMRAIIFLADGNADKAALHWLDSPVWQHREALVERFVFAKAQNNVQLQQILNANALDVLYLIYSAMCDLIKFNLNSNTEHLYVLNVKQLQVLGKKIDYKNSLLYLTRLQQAIRDVHEIVGMNKLLMFQDLYVCAQRLIR